MHVFWGGMRGIFRGCMVFSGGVCGFFGGVHGFSGVLFFLGGEGHAWLFWGVCMVFWGGMHSFLGGALYPMECIGYNEIRSMSGWYASYWMAFLFINNFRRRVYCV